MRSHIRGLCEKNYQNLYGVSLDFVILFVPIEGAYSVALQAEPGLYQEAFDKNIALVSATSLWSTLRTVGTLWRQERQNANVQEIIRQASDLYDKFAGFSEELVKVGNQMDTAKRTYENSNKMLQTYRGTIGGKTGFTTLAGGCLAVAVRRGGHTIVGVILNTNDIWGDMPKLIDAAFKRSPA